MVKYIQTIRWEQPTKCLSVFDHFMRLGLKELKLLNWELEPLWFYIARQILISICENWTSNLLHVGVQIHTWLLVFIIVKNIGHRTMKGRYWICVLYSKLKNQLFSCIKEASAVPQQFLSYSGKAVIVACFYMIIGSCPNKNKFLQIQNFPAPQFSFKTHTYTIEAFMSVFVLDVL